MLFFTTPMDWKNCVTTIWKPISGKALNIICILCTDMSMSLRSVVKALTIYSGTNRLATKPIVTTTVAHAMVRNKTDLTRSVLPAPKL